MKLCQENTELAEKLKSIIDQYELREEVSGALAAGWDGQHTQRVPGEAGSTASSLAIIWVSHRGNKGSPHRALPCQQRCACSKPSGL